MFCPQCGANNADTAAVCVQCGRNLQVSATQVGSAQPPYQQIPSQATPLQTPGVILPPGTAVPNYLVFAILATVLCCIPTGIPAIVYAAQVNSKLQIGDWTGAQAASKNAKMWCWISFGVGLGGGLLWMLIVAVGTIRQIGAH